MKVVCIGNSGEILPTIYLDPKAGVSKDREFPLTVGKQYVVYALAIRKNQIWYYLADDHDLYCYPAGHPAPLFEVVDTRLSKYWRYALTPQHLDHLALFAFTEWVSDEYFYDRLTDCKEAEVSIYRKMRSLMEAEAESEDTGSSIA